MIGKIVSHYKIIEKIGQGGMGVVYKAHDTNLGRTVALKFLPSDSPTAAEVQQRFRHEARAASALDHQNICTIYEIGETDEGQSFIAMAFYEGESLKERIRRGCLEIEEAVDIILQLAEGIAKAHDKGIIHRDLKPANIFITTDGIVKILDFGIAKIAGSTRLTRTDSLPGTVAYMSPEQIQGGVIDQGADIWSLGVILFEMLTGQLPFDGEFEQTLSYAIVHKEAKPVKVLRDDVSIMLEAVLNKCLTKNVIRRYQNISGLQEDLTRVAGLNSSSREDALKLVKRSYNSGLFKIELKRSLISAAATLTIIVIILIPLKIWRTTILYRERILYIPSQVLLSSPTRERVGLNIAVIVPEDPRSIIDIAGKIKFPEILSCKNSSPEKLESLQPYVDQLKIRHFWKNTTLLDRIADGFFDRIDDFPFWSTFGIAFNAWLLLSCVTRLKKDHQACYQAASKIPKHLYIVWIAIGLLWNLLPIYFQQVVERGIIHGAFWTSDFIPGVRTTQVVDFMLYSIVLIIAAYLFIVKVHLVRTMTSMKFRGLFYENSYLQAWEYLLNSGYFPLLFVNLITILIATFFQELVEAWNKAQYIMQSFVFYLPFLVITLVAWWLTRYRVDYKLSQVPFFVFWISAAKRIN